MEILKKVKFRRNCAAIGKKACRIVTTSKSWIQVQMITASVMKELNKKWIIFFTDVWEWDISIDHEQVLQR